MNAGRLVMPALRWSATTGYAHEEPNIAAALAVGVGGFIVFGGPAPEISALSEALRRRADRPLLLAADLERGAGQQFAGLEEWPPPRALAALGDVAVIAAAGRSTAEDARSVGIDWVFAPDVDLDLEPKNPIVQTRSFGETPFEVGERAATWIRAARAAGIMTTAKHFPGHGRAVIDSHDSTPIVDLSLDDWRASDAVPFRAAIAAGVDAVMTAHIAFPGLDPSGLPATRSRLILDRLRDELGFQGIIVSDALNMGGFSGSETPVDASLDAVAAGVDVLLYPADPVATVEALRRRAAADSSFADRIEASLKRLDQALTFQRRSIPAGDEDLSSATVAGRLIERSAPPATLRAPIELVVVDDDLDGAYPASPSGYVGDELATAGVRLGQGGSRVILAFAEPRASKGRAGFGPRSRAELAKAAPGADLIILFGHERLAAELPPGVPVVVGWHRQALMQKAAAHWLRGLLGT